MTFRPAMPGRGFSLLETVVAMALLAATGMALFGLFNTNMITLTRAGDVSAQVPVVRHAMEKLTAINPAVAQEGRFAVGDHEVRWTAELVEPMRSSQSPIGDRGPYLVGLFDLEFRVYRQGDQLGAWRMRHVGYRDLRAPASSSQ